MIASFILSYFCQHSLQYKFLINTSVLNPYLLEPPKGLLITSEFPTYSTIYIHIRHGDLNLYPLRTHGTINQPMNTCRCPKTEGSYRHEWRILHNAMISPNFRRARRIICRNAAFSSQSLLLPTTKMSMDVPKFWV